VSDEETCRHDWPKSGTCMFCVMYGADDAGEAKDDDPTYKLTVTYALGHDQEHPGLTADAVEQGFVAFFHDLTQLKGAGIQRVSIEIEGERNERGGYVPGLG
jgi:hypothetical protein